MDYFQREYRWGQRQIEQMLADFQSTFEEFYNPDNHDTPEEVMNYGFYYMGCIICTGGSIKKIILTEMTRVTDIYLRMKDYGSKLTLGYENFKVVNGTSTLVADAPWESEESKQKLDPNKEVFHRSYMEEIRDGY